MIESPQSFVTRQECDKIAFQGGYRREKDETGGWRRYESTTALGQIWLASTGKDDWFIAIDHHGIKNEIAVEPCAMDGPGIVRYQFNTLAELYVFLPRVYALGVSLPDAPLQEFIKKTEQLPKTTEAERLVVQRIGQNIFRDRLMNYWQGQCPLTGISDKALLRSSHIKAWKDCKTDVERLDVYNGLLLSALWDAAFDRGLATFNIQGQPEFSPELSGQGRFELRWEDPIPLTENHQKWLKWHRKHVFKNGD